MPKRKVRERTKIHVQMEVEDIIAARTEKTIKIAGLDYAVIMVKPNTVITADRDLGGVLDDQMAIRIRKDVPLVNRESSLLHESLHVLDYKYALGLSEETIMRLETGIYSWLVDNGIDLAPLARIVRVPEDCLSNENKDGD